MVSVVDTCFLIDLIREDPVRFGMPKKSPS